MENSLNYSFDDEVAEKFYYDMNNKIIHVFFSGYSDLVINDRFLDKKCVLVIEKWETARCRIEGENKFKSLNDSIGVFSMILSIKKYGSSLEMYINTLDGRYMLIIFEKSNVFLKYE